MSDEPQSWWLRVEDSPWRDLGPCSEEVARQFIYDTCKYGGILYLCREKGADPIVGVYWNRADERVEIHENPVRPRYWESRNG